jgi:hypothetical protein
MYGLDSYVLGPPLSVIVSILLILGCDGLGAYTMSIFGLKIDFVKWHRWQAPIIGALVLSILLYPLALIGIATLSVFRAVALLLVGLSIVHLGSIIIRYRRLQICWSSFLFSNLGIRSIWLLLPVVLLLSLGGYALAPITNADSLDYHVGVALHILRTGSMPVTPEWFTSRLAGNGEVLNALGLAVGAEQFGSLLQFVGLLGIVGLIYHSEAANANTNTNLQNEWKTLLTIVSLSSPVLIFLIGSAKPQLLPISMTTLAVAIILYPSRRNLGHTDQLKGFSLVCLLVMVASQAKFSYLLGGGIVGIIALIVMFKKRLFFSAVVIGVISALIVLAPPVLWKHINFGGGYLESLLSPFPGEWPGSDKFEIMLRNYRDSAIHFPFSLVFPSGIGTISTIIGIGAFSPLFLKPKKDFWLWTLIFGAVIVFILGAILGSTTSRSYLEPFFWILIVLSLQEVPVTYSKYGNWLKVPVIMFSGIMLSMSWFGIITALPGSFSHTARTHVMMRMADGYDVMRWVDKTLPKDAVLLNGHRSMGLSPRNAISLDWMNYTQLDLLEPKKYLERIKIQNATHLLLIGNNYMESALFRYFSSCLGTEVYGPGLGHRATRNPFNAGPDYKLWMVGFNSDLLPDCVLSDLKSEHNKYGEK